MQGYREGAPRWPRIDEAIKEHGGVNDFIQWSGLHERTYYRLQSYGSNPTKFVIDKVLGYTGLTYEQAFQEE